MELLSNSMNKSLNESDSPHTNQCAAYDVYASLLPAAFDKEQLGINSFKLRVSQLESQLHRCRDENDEQQKTIIELKRKLTHHEKERLLSTTKCNEEIARLEATTTRLRSELEKNEAIRLDVEYQILATRRLGTDEKEQFSKRDEMMKDVNASLKEKLTLLKEENSQLHQKVDEFRLRAEHQDETTKQEMRSMNSVFAKLESDCAVLTREKAVLEGLVKQKELCIAGFREEVDNLKDKLNDQSKNYQRQGNDYDFLKEREEKLRADLDSALHRARALEEGIEAERTCHLEAKFNTEVIQLRLRDLQDSVEKERSMKEDAMKRAEQLEKQLHDLENGTEEFKLNYLELKDKYSQIECESDYSKAQLIRELEEKRKIVQELSEQIRHYQTNFVQVKIELEKAKQRQEYLENYYGTSMLELEKVVNEFKLRARTTKGKCKKADDPLTPSEALAILREAIAEFTRKITKHSTEVHLIKGQSDALLKEKELLAEQLKLQETAIQKCQGELQRVKQERDKLKLNVNKEKEANKKKVDIIESGFEHEKAKLTNLKEEHETLVARMRTTEEEVDAALSKLAGTLKCHLRSKPRSWKEWGTVLQERAAEVMEMLQRVQERNLKLEETTVGMEHQLENVHANQLRQLINKFEEKESEMRQEVAELRVVTQQLRQDAEARIKESQTSLSQATARAEQADRSAQSLRRHAEQLQQQRDVLGQERVALSVACLMLAALCHPLARQRDALRIQKQVLLYQLEQLMPLKRRAQDLLRTMRMEEEPRPLQRIWRWRSVCIAVLAALRIAKGARRSSVIAVDASESTPLFFEFPVCQSKKDGGRGLLSWLNGFDIAPIKDAVGDLVAMLPDSPKGQGSLDASKSLLRRTASSSISRLWSCVQQMFLNSEFMTGLTSNDYNSLMNRISRGFSGQVRKLSPQDKLLFMSSSDTMLSLQKCLIELTQRLRDVEVDRRNLKRDLLELDRVCHDLKSEKGNSQGLMEKLRFLEKERETLISKDKMERVCVQLDDALSREKKAQQILVSQGMQVERLSKELEKQCSENKTNGQLYDETSKELIATQNQLKYKQQLISQCNERVHCLDAEKKTLEKTLLDADQALRKVTRDRDTLHQYMKTIDAAIQKIKEQLQISRNAGDDNGVVPTLARLLVTSELGPAEKLSNEVLSCQNMVGAFAELFEFALRSTVDLSQDIACYKQHIAALKRELSAACRREMIYDSPVPAVTEEDKRPALRHAKNVKSSQNFFPIPHSNDLSPYHSMSHIPCDSSIFATPATKEKS